jgi:hypothetical protein
MKLNQLMIKAAASGHTEVSDPLPKMATAGLIKLALKVRRLRIAR